MARSFALLVALALGAISCSGDPSSTATGRPASVNDPRFTRISAYGVSAEVPGAGFAAVGATRQGTGLTDQSTTELP